MACVIVKKIIFVRIIIANLNIFLLKINSFIVTLKIMFVKMAVVELIIIMLKIVEKDRNNFSKKEPFKNKYEYKHNVNMGKNMASPSK